MYYTGATMHTYMQCNNIVATIKLIGNNYSPLLVSCIFRARSDPPQIISYRLAIVQYVDTSGELNLALVLWDMRKGYFNLNTFLCHFSNYHYFKALRDPGFPLGLQVHVVWAFQSTDPMLEATASLPYYTSQWKYEYHD